MEPDIYAVVVDGVVVNVVMWDGVSDWRPEKGEAVKTGGTVGIGWLYSGGEFTPPEQKEQAS
ncbi:hypothetical protein ACOAKA_10205 [Escherichia coli]|uniref:hypothetical protein n=1 Tax=Escherichia coli TaxID=562 RepID=UPI003B24B0C5